MKITLSAYAKINLSLGIVGRRSDGYHLIQSVMQKISLADTVSLEPRSHGITIQCNRASVPTNEKNLCYRAADAYRKAAGIQNGVKIELHLSVPDMAGLGAGSADAAATLRAMKALYPSNVDLAQIANTIGADVAFALNGKTALCEGIGEKLTELSFPAKGSLHAVIIKGEKGLSTPEVYSLFDRIEAKDTIVPQRENLIGALGQKNPDMLFSMMHNDLELPAIALLPEILEQKNLLLENGADAAMMTGSGSAVFGLFTDEKKARSASEELKKHLPFSEYCTLI